MMLFTRYYYKCFLLIAILLNYASPLATSTSSNARIRKIKVEPVKGHDDVIALADLRYDEFILDDAIVEGERQHQPSRSAFRMGTADIHSDRSRRGAMSYLARLRNENDENCVIGAAEASPIEFDGVLRVNSQYDNTSSSNNKNSNPYANIKMLYITDVVTAKLYRRQGVAYNLMKRIEEDIFNRFGDDEESSYKSIMLFLHVDPNNAAAQKLYQSDKLSYEEPTSELLNCIDINRLETNAGTKNQMLLCKKLQRPIQPSSSPIERKGGIGVTGAGFGTVKASKRLKKAKKQKSKR